LGLIIVDPNNSLLVVVFLEYLLKACFFLKEKVAIGLVPLPPPIFAKDLLFADQALAVCLRPL